MFSADEPVTTPVCTNFGSRTKALRRFGFHAFGFNGLSSRETCAKRMDQLRAHQRCHTSRYTASTLRAKAGASHKDEAAMRGRSSAW